MLSMVGVRPFLFLDCSVAVTMAVTALVPCRATTIYDMNRGVLRAAELAEEESNTEQSSVLNAYRSESTRINKSIVAPAIFPIEIV
jgi:hypothetical protein